MKSRASLVPNPVDQQYDAGGCPPSPSPQAERHRLIHLDAFRGFIILVMIIIHPLAGLIYGCNRGAINETSLWVLILGAPLAIVATWAPVFILTSGTANAYVMATSLRKRPGDTQALRRMLFRGFLNGGVLYLLSMVNMSLLHVRMEFNGAFHDTLLTSYLLNGVVPEFSPELLFYTDALAMLGITGIFTTTLLCFLLRDGGKNLRRVYAVVGGTATALILISPLLHGWLDGVFYGCVSDHRWLAAFGLKCIIGPRFSPVPLLAYALFGALFGIGIAHGKSLSWFRRLGYSTGAVMLGLFGAAVALFGFRYMEFTLDEIPMKIHLLDMGLIVLVATLLLEWSEFRSAACRNRFAWWTADLRRLGRVSLTVFLTETVLSVLMVKPYLALWGVDTFPQTPQAVIPFLAIVVAFWVCAVRVWERFGYKYGLEWFLVWLNKTLVGHKSQRLVAAPPNAERATS